MQNGLWQVFWIYDSKTAPKSFAGFVDKLFDKTIMSLERLALVAYSVHVVLLNNRDTYWRRLVQSGNNFVTYIPYEPAAEQQDSSIILVRMEEFFVRVLSACSSDKTELESTDVFTDGRELKLRVLHKALLKISSEFEEIYL